MRAGQRNLWPTHSERGLYGHLLVYERGKWSSACGVLAPGTRSAWGPHVTSHTRPGRPSPAPPSVCSWAGRGVMAAGSTGLAQGPLRRPFIRGQPLLRQSHLFPKNSRTCPTPLAFTSFHSPFWSCCCFPGPGSARHPWVPCTFAQIMLIHTLCTHTYVHTHMYTHSTPSPSPSFRMVFSTFQPNWSTLSPASWMENQEQGLHSLWTANNSSNSILDLRHSPESSNLMLAQEVVPSGVLEAWRPGQGGGGETAGDRILTKGVSQGCSHCTQRCIPEGWSEQVTETRWSSGAAHRGSHRR